MPQKYNTFPFIFLFSCPLLCSLQHTQQRTSRISPRDCAQPGHELSLTAVPVPSLAWVRNGVKKRRSCWKEYSIKISGFDTALVWGTYMLGPLKLRNKLTYSDLGDLDGKMGCEHYRQIRHSVRADRRVENFSSSWLPPQPVVSRIDFASLWSLFD